MAATPLGGILLIERAAGSRCGCSLEKAERRLGKALGVQDHADERAAVAQVVAAHR